MMKLPRALHTITGIVAGFVNFAAGAWIWIVFWPNVQFQVPADIMFRAVAPVGLLTAACAARGSRLITIVLTLNAFLGLWLGMFAAFYFHSYTAWVGFAALGAVPSVLAIVLKAVSPSRGEG